MLISAGMLKMPFSKYAKYNIAAEALLVVIFMTIGYVFGISYQSVSKDLRVVMMVSLFVLFIIGLFVIRYYMAKKKPLT
jgi:membrane protein DedA with SNARE-associated domain